MGNHYIDTSRPSAAIAQAVADLDAAERTDGFVVNMNRWHDPSRNGCHVCFGGAVLARAFDYNAAAWLEPSQIPDDTQAAFVRAMDYIRMPEYAEVSQGLRIMGVPEEVIGYVGILWEGHTLPQYAEDPGTFKADRLRLASVLESYGH